MSIDQLEIDKIKVMAMLIQSKVDLMKLDVSKEYEDSRVGFKYYPECEIDNINKLLNRLAES